MMLAYAKHEQMCIFVLDPQGEFSKKIRESPRLQELLKKDLKKEIKLANLHNLVLSGWDLFKKILIHAGFFKELGIHHETNQQQAANELVRIIQRTDIGQKKAKPWDAYNEGVFENIWHNLPRDEILARIYSSQDLRNRVKSSFNDDEKPRIRDLWIKVANLFKYHEKSESIVINQLVEEIEQEKGKIILIDLSEVNIPQELFWNDTIKFIVIGEVIKRLKMQAEDSFKKDRLINALVVVDEAHRLAPRERSPIDDLELLKAMFIDGVRTTRKYCLGWMFISQTLSSLDKRIVEQIRIYLFGFGLSWGIERQALLEIIGGQNEALRLYQMFQDPHSSLGRKEFPFMTIGPISPLSFSGTPLFFNAFNFPTEFLQVNFKKKA